MITVRDLERVPPERRPSTRLRDIAPRTNAPLVRPNTALPELLLSLHVHGGTAIVIDGGHPVGMVTEVDIARAAKLADRRGFEARTEPPGRPGARPRSGIGGSWR